MIIGKTYYLTRDHDQVTFKVVAKNWVEITILENGETTQLEKNGKDACQYWQMLQNAGFAACREDDLPIVLIED